MEEDAVEAGTTATMVKSVATFEYSVTYNGMSHVCDAMMTYVR